MSICQNLLNLWSLGLWVNFTPPSSKTTRAYFVASSWLIDAAVSRLAPILSLLTTPHSYNPSDSHQVAVALQGLDTALLEVHSYALYSNFFQTRWRCPHSLLHFGWIMLYPLLILQFARWGRRRTVVVLHADRIFLKGFSLQYSSSWRLRSCHSPPLTSVFIVPL